MNNPPDSELNAAELASQAKLEAERLEIKKRIEESQRLAKPSASSWGRRELCTASLMLEAEAKAVGQQACQDSTAAASGTAIHLGVRELGEAGAFQTPIDEAEGETARIMKSHSDEQLDRLFSPRQPEVIRERRLSLNLDGTPALSGQFDLVAYNKEQTLAVVQDFKTGFAEPGPAEDNSQMKILALLVGLNMPTVQEVVVQLISGPHGVTEARYSMAQLGAIYEETVVLLKRLQDPNAVATPSPEACKFCTAKLVCQAFRDQVVAPMTKLRVSTLPTQPERAAKVLADMEMLTSFLKEVKIFYSNLLESDPTYRIPGWEMVPGNVVREVTDWDAARARLSEYLPIDQLKSAADYRLGELEKALGKVLNLKGELLRNRMNVILKDLVTEKQNAASLKRVSKKRAAKVNETD